jgi:hypothetical protein
MANLTLSQEFYEALVALARRGTRRHDGSIDQNAAVNLDSFLRSIEKANGITRYSLHVQWQDPTAPLPPGTNFPETWPPSLRYHIEFISRPVAQTDVLTVVAQRTPNATNILVTPDPAGLLGWTPVASYFLAG